MYSSISSNIRLLLALLLFAVIALGKSAYAEVVVIVHPSNSVSLDQTVIKKIFMGKTKTFPDGKKAVPVDIEAGDMKKLFLKQYLQKDQSAIDSYWSRMLFTGAGTPPKAYQTQGDIKRLVANNPNTIGYIDSSQVDSTVKVVKFN